MNGTKHSAQERKWASKDFPQNQVYPLRISICARANPPDSPLSVLTTLSSDDSDPDDQSGNESDFSHESSLSNVAPERYEYIHRSLCNLRLVIALDTMHNHVPINLLLEYLNRELIRLRRNVVGPEEFEQYLRHIAIEKKICFKYSPPLRPSPDYVSFTSFASAYICCKVLLTSEPHSLFIHPLGAIDITILPTGWPSDQELLPHPRPLLPPLHRDTAHLAMDVSDFRLFTLDQEMWRMREAPPRAPRFMFVDIDSEDIRTYFNSLRDERMEVDADVFEHIVAACPDLWV